MIDMRKTIIQRRNLYSDGSDDDEFTDDGLHAHPPELLEFDFELSEGDGHLDAKLEQTRECRR